MRQKKAKRLRKLAKYLGSDLPPVLYGIDHTTGAIMLAECQRLIYKKFKHDKQIQTLDCGTD